MTVSIGAKKNRQFEKFGRFHKVEGNTAFGWAFVSEIDGVPYFDTGDGIHSDNIPQESVMDVAKSFMAASRVGLDMHAGAQVAEVLFAMPATDDILAGIEMTSRKRGLTIGWTTDDADLLEKIAKGERIGFSIGGLVDAWDIVDVNGTVIESVNLIGKGSKVTFGSAVGKSAGYDGTDGKMKRRVFRSWKLQEISLVDRPMQEPALIGVVKGAVATRVKKLKTLASIYTKAAVLTSSDAGHQHVLDPADVDCEGMGYTRGAETKDGNWHSHPWMRGEDGSIEIADNAGHGHSTDAKAPKPETVTVEDSDEFTPVPIVADVSVIEMRGKSARGNLTADPSADSLRSMQDAKDIEIAALKAERDSLMKRAARAEKLALIGDGHRTFAQTLPPTEQDDFISKSFAERAVVVKASVEYTSPNGTVYFKHDDARMIETAKRADATDVKLAESENLRKRAEYAEKATKFASRYPVDADVQIAMVSALDSIGDEKLRKGAFDALTAGQNAIARLTKSGRVPVGEDIVKNMPSNELNAGDAGDVEKLADALKVAVTEYQATNKIRTYEIAFNKALQADPKCQELYEQLADARAEN